MKMQKTPEELRRLLELRRSGASGAIPSKKYYSRKAKRQSLMLELKQQKEGPSND
jgi:hypothetical protein